MVIKFNNDLYSIFSMTHRTPGNLRGFVQVKMRNLRSGSQTEHRFSSEDRVDKVSLDEREMEYMYDDGESYYFMDTENFEQITLSREWVGEQIMFLKEGAIATVVLYGEKPISLDLPGQVKLAVTEAAPALKGATASAQYKWVTTETGLKVNVPGSIDAGDAILVDTATGEYLSRVGK